MADGMCTICKSEGVETPVLSEYSLLCLNHYGTCMYKGCSSRSTICTTTGSVCKKHQHVGGAPCWGEKKNQEYFNSNPNNPQKTPREVSMKKNNIWNIISNLMSL